MFWDVPGCSAVFQGVPGCSRVFQGVSEYSGVFRAVPGVPGFSTCHLQLTMIEDPWKHVLFKNKKNRLYLSKTVLVRNQQI